MEDVLEMPNNVVTLPFSGLLFCIIYFYFFHIVGFLRMGLLCLYFNFSYVPSALICYLGFKMIVLPTSVLILTLLFSHSSL